jgi:uncharacterized protein (TIGR02271 family)
MTQSMQQVRLDEMRGRPVYDLNGDKIGSVEEIFYDDQSQRPEWIGVGTGFFKTKRVLVPVQGASLQEDGICVAYGADQVKDSPDIDGDDISDRTEQELYQYYRLDGTRGDTRGGTRGKAPKADADQALTRSEEELQVGKERTQAGSVRLRKWVETEPVALDVELQRETARVVRERVDKPVDSKNAFNEEQIEVPLQAERPVTSKRTVAKERIGVEKNVESETRKVRDEVRKERVDVDGDGDIER